MQWRRIHILLPIITVFLLSWYLYTLKEIVPFHEDEHVYINRAIFYDLYSKKDFSSPLWHRYESYDVKLPELIYGMIITKYKKTSVQDYIAVVGFNTSVTGEDSWNHYYARQYLPMSELPRLIYDRIEPVRIARWGSLALSIGSLLSLVAIWLLLDDWLAGLIAVLLLGLHPLYTYATLTAMGDGPLAFFSLLTLLVSLLLSRSARKTGRYIFLSVLLGVFSGFAVSSKLNGLLSFFYACTASFVCVVQNNSNKRMLHACISMLLILFIGATVVLVINPHLWNSPIHNFLQMGYDRKAIIAFQQGLFPQDALRTPSERVAAVLRWAFSRHESYGVFPIVWQEVALTLVGVFALLCEIYKSYDATFVMSHKRTSLVLFSAWCLIIAGATTVLIPLDWNRYYLPIVIVVTMVQSFGASFALRTIFAAGRRTLRE